MNTTVNWAVLLINCFSSNSPYCFFVCVLIHTKFVILISLNILWVVTKLHQLGSFSSFSKLCISLPLMASNRVMKIMVFWTQSAIDKTNIVPHQTHVVLNGTKKKKKNLANEPQCLYFSENYMLSLLFKLKEEVVFQHWNMFGYMIMIPFLTFTHTFLPTLSFQISESRWGGERRQEKIGNYY